MVDVAAMVVTAGLAVAAADTERPVQVGSVAFQPVYFEPIAVGLGVVAAIFAISAWHGTNEYCADNPDARC